MTAEVATYPKLSAEISLSHAIYLTGRTNSIVSNHSIQNPQEPIYDSSDDDWEDCQDCQACSLFIPGYRMVKTLTETSNRHNTMDKLLKMFTPKATSSKESTGQISDAIYPREKEEDDDELSHIPEQELGTFYKECYFQIEGDSHAATSKQLHQVIETVPSIYHFQTWKCHFSTKTDGVSLNTFYRKVSKVPVSIIVIRDSQKKVFGGFVSATWTKKHSAYYGFGESFVFSFSPDFSTYGATGFNQYFQQSTDERLVMGGGSNAALYLDRELFRGYSGESETFLNPCLASAPDFTCVCMEIWAPCENLYESVRGFL